MFANNQFSTLSQDERSAQAQDCTANPIAPSTKYTSEALDVFDSCFHYMRHFLAIDLHRLQKHYPCTIADIDLRYHIRNWVDISYLEGRGYGSADSVNILLDELGLPQIDEKTYAKLERSDPDAADDLFYKCLDNAVEYIQSGIYENWLYLCEQSDDDAAVCQYRTHSAPQEWFAFSSNFAKPEQYTPLARKLLYDFFCYMYRDITRTPKQFLNAYTMSCMASVWLKRTYYDHKDARCVLKILFLLGEILGVDVKLPEHGLPAYFWKTEEPLWNFQFRSASWDIAEYIGNCLIDLWDEFVEEYFNEDFQTMSLIDFVPGEE